MTGSAPSAPAGRVGGLLVALGTPAAPTTKAVRAYLREFLSDPRVIDLPAPLRWMLVNLVIAPFRAPHSAAAYRRIWTEEGSPLRVHAEALRDAVRARLGDTMPVELAMRYGAPSIASALQRLRAAGAREIRVLPLYPQWAASTSGSVTARVYELAADRWEPERILVLPPFFDDPGFVGATVGAITAVLEAHPVEALVCSYHGLPERHVHKSSSEAAPCTLDDVCCAEVHAHNARCYRAQCMATTRRIAEALGRPDLRIEYGFQSRLGRDPWLGPTTTEVLDRLAAEGVRHVAVACPSFVADCLETLEEIGIAARERFIAQGGANLVLVPAANADPRFADAVARMLQRGAQPVGDGLVSLSAPTARRADGA